MPLELSFVCWQIPKIHPREEKRAINWFVTAFWSYLNPNSPKYFPPSLTLGLKAHMKNFSRQRVCVISACLCSHLVQHRRGLRHQIRAADLPGKSPVGRGAHGSLKGLFGFLWVYLGLSRFIWVYLSLFALQSKPIFVPRKNHWGTRWEQNKHSWWAAAMTWLKHSWFAFLLNSGKASPAPLQVCAAWAAQRDGWQRDNKPTDQIGIIQD